MVSCILNKRGFTILEVTVVVIIIGAILSMLIPNCISRINEAKYEKTVSELTTIAQACVDYYNFTGSWPDPANWSSELYPKFIPDGGNSANAVTSSPFGTAYNILPINNYVTAYVFIPSGIAQNNPLEGQLLTRINQGSQDKIEITQTVPSGSTARLNYCLKNDC